MKAMLLRIGIDKGTDSTLAPIFEDGSFEYIPLSESDENSREDRTYVNTIGRKGRPLSDYVPFSIWGKKMHFDPEFNTFTYGDPTSKRWYLTKLDKGDLLVFYAGLTPFMNQVYKEALYIIGYFLVDKVIDFNQLSESEIEDAAQLFPSNAHIKRKKSYSDLVIVVGNKEHSKLLDTAILISKPKLDKRGRPYHAVSDEMEELLGISGSIQRSIPPRMIYEQKYIVNLKGIIKMK